MKGEGNMNVFKSATLSSRKDSSGTHQIRMIGVTRSACTVRWLPHLLGKEEQGILISTH